MTSETRPIIGGPLDGGTHEIVSGGALAQSFIGKKAGIYHRYVYDMKREAWVYDRATKPAPARKGQP